MGISASSAPIEYWGQVLARTVSLVRGGRRVAAGPEGGRRPPAGPALNP
jgi:hypothetical protein